MSSTETASNMPDALLSSSQQTSSSVLLASFPPDDEIAEDIATTSFFDLPPELRDMVYTLLYGERSVFKIKSRTAFREAEARRKKKLRGRYVPYTFPESSISHLLCSKQFFFEASRVWTANKIFTCDNLPTILACMSDVQSVDRQVLQHITEIRLGCVYGRIELVGHYLPKLAHVSVVMFPSHLELNDGELAAWEDDFTDADLANIDWVGYLLKFRNLKSLTIRWYGCPEAETSEQEQRIAKTQTRVQALVNDIVTQSREVPHKPATLPTFDQALSASIAARKSKTAPEPPMSTKEVRLIGVPVPPLEHHQIPETSEGLVRLMQLRPVAFVDWVLKAKADGESREVAH